MTENEQKRHPHFRAVETLWFWIDEMWQYHDPRCCFLQIISTKAGFCWFGSLLRPQCLEQGLAYERRLIIVAGWMTRNELARGILFKCGRAGVQTQVFDSKARALFIAPSWGYSLLPRSSSSFYSILLLTKTDMWITTHSWNLGSYYHAWGHSKHTVCINLSNLHLTV